MDGDLSTAEGLHMENTSGQGRSAAVPAEIDCWNWGAFLLNWIWGIGNNTFIALLMFVPLVNVVMAFVLGAKGSAWAWRNKRWDSVDQFRTVQRKWALWGVVVFAASMAGCVALFFGIAGSMRSSEAFQLSLARLEASPEVAESLGKPLKAGFPMGSIQVSGAGGSARLSYGVTGPKGKGTAYVTATRDLGRWHIDRMTFEQDVGGRHLELVQ